MIQIKSNKAMILKNMTFLLCLSMIVLILPSCNKSKNQSQLSVRMTDAPGDYDAVNVDVQAVEITGSKGGTVKLNTSVGLYNLLSYSNGANVLIATGGVDAGTISQIRLILGNNSTVTVDGVVYPLSTPSADQSGLKIQVNQEYEAGVSYNILLDFDAGQSIVKTGSGEYKLKPVVRTIDVDLGGTIKGSISPVGLSAAVLVTSNGKSYSTIVASNGEFQISGLPAGNYSITFTPALPLLPITVSGKAVTLGTTTDIGVVLF